MNSLQEFALLNGVGEPPAPPPALPTYEEQEESFKRVGLLKQSIMEQLQGGNDPESILYTALEALSLATHDPDFLEQGASFLNGDKVEQSFFLDLEKMQEKRNERRRLYLEKRRKEIKRQMEQLDADQRTLRRELEHLPKEGNLYGNGDNDIKQ